ncbi:MAG TPA: MFS transporter, partial [Gemmatimonadaceae bacterium]
GLGRVIMWATLAFGVSLMAFSASRHLWLSMAVLVVVGAGFMIQLAATNTVLQTLVEERFRGRVMAFYTMAVLGTAPIGSLIAGMIASRAGAPITIAVGGFLCVFSGAWFASQLPTLRRHVRPIYVERGIITVPAVDSGSKTL